MRAGRVKKTRTPQLGSSVLLPGLQQVAGRGAAVWLPEGKQLQWGGEPDCDGCGTKRTSAGAPAVQKVLTPRQGLRRQES